MSTARIRRDQATRAVTVHAPAKAVWPWIVQIGQDRAGFYSYDVLENLFGAKMPSVDEIVPEWQHRTVGDTVWLSTPDSHGGNARMIVGWLELERAMVLDHAGGR
jgi:hypothetical protein